ncbi:MAG: hypothetical protein KIT80_18660 [Chitinophagaceae bacterium]|nr:hypothetical protein [Chitinophagaceae bacterium]MCW5928949.1 hypothetical protein [Chitinophagaceae bacterium]
MGRRMWKSEDVSPETSGWKCRARIYSIADVEGIWFGFVPQRRPSPWERDKRVRLNQTS